jgi:antitoxin component of MazEF toxin-antitoxin module
MSTYTTTVIKTGNSYALRVPKAYIENANLSLGDKADIPLPATKEQYNPVAIKKAIRELQRVGAFKDIKDPVAWQREIRKDRPLPFRD